MIVTQINSDTLMDFIRREGVVITTNVSNRFGWDYRTTRRKLDELERKGLIRRHNGPRRFSEEGYGGKRIEWRSA